MKKMLTVLALVLALALCVPAMADIASYTVDTYDVSLNPKTGTLAVADYDAGCYVLMDAAGNKLTQEKYLYMSSYETGFQIALEEGTNNIGFINGQGALLVPPQYGDIEWLSEDWQIGVVLVHGEQVGPAQPYGAGAPGDGQPPGAYRSYGVAGGTAACRH